MRFDYTHKKDVDSSALKTVLYNENHNKLVVITHEDRAYCYRDVPLVIYNTLVNTGSVGNYYAVVIKRGYGPHAWSQSRHYVEFVDANALASDMSSTSVEAFSNVGSSTGPHVHAQAVGTPKGLTYAEGAEVTQREDFITLTTQTDVAPTAVKLKFEFHVFFTLNGSEKMFATSAGSVNEALENYKAATSWLDLETKVVKVVQYFE